MWAEYMGTNQRLVDGAAIVILVVWFVSVVNGMLTGDYEATQLVTPIMLILAGYLFTRDVIASRLARKEEK